MFQKKLFFKLFFNFHFGIQLDRKIGTIGVKMSIDTTFEAKILVEARRYYENYDRNSLEELLTEEWVKTEGTAMPVRSGDSSAKRIINRLLKQFAEITVETVTVALISAKVIEHFEKAGYDVAGYQIIIAITVAILVKALLGEWKEPPPDHF